MVSNSENVHTCVTPYARQEPWQRRQERQMDIDCCLTNFSGQRSFSLLGLGLSFLRHFTLAPLPVCGMELGTHFLQKEGSRSYSWLKEKVGERFRKQQRSLTLNKWTEILDLHNRGKRLEVKETGGSGNTNFILFSPPHWEEKTALTQRVRKTLKGVKQNSKLWAAREDISNLSILFASLGRLCSGF